MTDFVVCISDGPWTDQFGRTSAPTVPVRGQVYVAYPTGPEEYVIPAPLRDFYLVLPEVHPRIAWRRDRFRPLDSSRLEVFRRTKITEFA